MALPSDWQTFLAAIRAQESGGNYTEDTAGCLGGYCWSSMTTWGNMARAAGAGKYADVNPSQVPADVQDQVASNNLYRVYQQAGGGSGGLSAAARWWNGGSTSSEANPGLPAQAWAPHCGEGSSGAYACQVLTRMGLGGHYVAGTGSGAGGVVSTTSATSAAGEKAASDCLWKIGFVNSTGSGPSAWGWIGAAGGEICLFSKSQARGIVGVANFALGAGVMGLGLALIFKTVAPRAIISLAFGNPAALLGTARGGAAAAAGAQVSSEQAGAAAAARVADREGRAADALYNQEQRRRARASSTVPPLPDIPRREGTRADSRGTSPEFRRAYLTPRQRAHRAANPGVPAASAAEAGF